MGKLRYFWALLQYYLWKTNSHSNTIPQQFLQTEESLCFLDLDFSNMLRFSWILWLPLAISTKRWEIKYVVFSTCICIRLTRKSQDKNRYDGRETCQLSNFSMSSIQPHENFDDHSTANRQNVKNFPSTPLEVR